MTNQTSATQCRSEKSAELVAEHVVNVDVERAELLSIQSMPILGDKYMHKSL